MSVSFRYPFSFHIPFASPTIYLPASAVATPMTYRARQGGRQYVVVAAGGHGKIKGIKLSDYVMAFALP